MELKNVVDIFQLWPILGGIITFIIWNVRLESKVSILERDHNILSRKHEELEAKILEDLSTIKQAVARIEGKLDA